MILACSKLYVDVCPWVIVASTVAVITPVAHPTLFILLPEADAQLHPVVGVEVRGEVDQLVAMLAAVAVPALSHTCPAVIASHAASSAHAGVTAIIKNLFFLCLCGFCVSYL